MVEPFKRRKVLDSFLAELFHGARKFLLRIVSKWIKQSKIDTVDAFWHKISKNRVKVPAYPFADNLFNNCERVRGGYLYAPASIRVSTRFPGIQDKALNVRVCLEYFKKTVPI